MVTSTPILRVPISPRVYPRTLPAAQTTGVFYSVLQDGALRICAPAVDSIHTPLSHVCLVSLQSFLATGCRTLLTASTTRMRSCNSRLRTLTSGRLNTCEE